jgi:hypothetical protein
LAESEHAVHVVAEHVRVMSAALLLPLTHSVALLDVALVLSVSKRGHHLAVCAAAAALVAGLHGAVGASLRIPHVEIYGGLLLGQNAVRKLVKGVRGSIWHAVGLQDVVVHFPLWYTVNISLSDIEEVSGNIDR